LGKFKRGTSPFWVGGGAMLEIVYSFGKIVGETPFKLRNPSALEKNILNKEQNCWSLMKY
jgi:hypothetical protein